MSILLAFNGPPVIEKKQHVYFSRNDANKVAFILLIRTLHWMGTRNDQGMIAREKLKQRLTKTFPKITTPPPVKIIEMSIIKSKDEDKEDMVAGNEIIEDEVISGLKVHEQEYLQEQVVSIYLKEEINTPSHTTQ